MIEINEHPKISFIEMFKGMPKTFKYNVTKKFWDLFVPDFTQRCMDEQIPYFECRIHHYVNNDDMEQICFYGYQRIISICFSGEPENFTEEGIEEGQDINFVLCTECTDREFKSDCIDFKDRPFENKDTRDEIMDNIIRIFEYKGKTE